ncbi:MAG: VOC family protein [Pseudomonadota bacterium]
MILSVSTFLMFTGQAEQAMNLYASLFKGATINITERWGAGEPVAEGAIKVATLSLCGHQVNCFDSPAVHAFTFTPSISLFVNLDDEAELETIFNTLSEGGGVLMPLNNYGFSKKFGWLNDRFGVSWQLNVP